MSIEKYINEQARIFISGLENRESIKGSKTIPCDRENRFTEQLQNDDIFSGRTKHFTINII